MIVARHEVPGLVRRDALLTSRQAVPACYPRDKIPGQPRVNPGMCFALVIRSEEPVIWTFPICGPKWRKKHSPGFTLGYFPPN
jgi:hypothetical protein